METLTFYIVKSQDGKYLRTTGFGGNGEHWVSDIKKAKVWNKIGPAHSQVTWWSNAYPDFGIPMVIPLVATPGEPIDQTDRVKKAQKTAKLKDLNNSLWRAQQLVDNNLKEMGVHKGQGWRYAQSKEYYEKNLKKLNKIKEQIAEIKAL